MDTKFITVLLGVLVVVAVAGIYLSIKSPKASVGDAKQLSTEKIEQGADQILEQELTNTLETQDTTDLENALLVQ